MKTFQHSRIASTTGENIKTTGLQIDYDATNTSKLQCTGSRQKLMWNSSFRKTAVFTWASLPDFETAVTRAWPSHRTYFPVAWFAIMYRIFSAFAIIFHIVWVRSNCGVFCLVCEDTVWPEVRNDYVFPNMGMGALNPQGKLPTGYLPRKISQHIYDVWRNFSRAHWPIFIINKRRDHS